MNQHRGSERRTTVGQDPAEPREVGSPDGAAQLRQVICASDSYKFYTPVPLASHGTDPADTGYPNAGLASKNRETEISQELWSTGYYIVTVDGPRATVDFYSADPDPATPGLADLDLLTTPDLAFSKRESFGYSLNGKEVLVPQGGSYELTDDTGEAIAGGEPGYVGTTATILGGANGSTAVDYNGRALTKAVNTGWSPAAEGLASDVFTLWGLADLGSEQTDTYALLMSFDEQAPRRHFGNGGFGIATRAADGSWINAVDLNAGGSKSFVRGPWDPGYGLGTCGVDASTKTAWAVVNHASDFAVATGIEPVPGRRK